jgi:hypothetical protein
VVAGVVAALVGSLAALASLPGVSDRLLNLARVARDLMVP